MTADVREGGSGGVPARARIAGLLFIGDAGFGLTMPFALAHLARTGELPMTPFGFRAFAGPFERLGPGPFTALGVALVGVCALEVLAGIWLWRGQRRGALLGLATTPAALVLGSGFALPFLLIPAPIRAGLAAAERRRLR